jgi:hypothetical protein
MVITQEPITFSFSVARKLGVCGFGQPAAMLLNNHDRRKHRLLDRLCRAARSLRLVNPGSGYGVARLTDKKGPRSAAQV